MCEESVPASLVLLEQFVTRGVVRCALGVVLLSVAALSSGCMYINSTVDAPYEVAESPATRAPSLPLALQVVDARSNTGEGERVGVKRNYYNTETADIVLDGPLNSWIANGLRRELEMAGFDLVEQDSASSAAATMTVKVTQFFVEPVASFSSADVNGITVLEVEVGLSESKRRFRRRFVGVASSSEGYVFDSDLESALQLSARDAFHQLVRATVVLFVEHG